MNVIADKPTAAGASRREPLGAFVEFAATTLGVSHEREGELLTLSCDHREHPSWPRPYRLQAMLVPDAGQRLPRKVVSATEAVAWLCQRAQLQSGALLARPATQPEAVHEISPRLFEAYQVDGGQTHLAGCRMKEVPFVRVTTGADESGEVTHRFYTAELEPVEESLVEQLGLDQLVPQGSHPMLVSRVEVQQLAERATASQEGLLAVTVVLAKRAEGAVQFDIDEQCAQVTFSDWTRQLKAPPFHCAASGRDTYHLAALDDGRIVAAEAIGVCEHSDTRLLESDLVVCATTGKRVDPALTSHCKVSDTVSLAEELVNCPTCGESVSRGVMDQGCCAACRELPVVRSGDPLVAGLLEQYPLLKKYGKLRAGERGGVLRLMAHGWWRRLLLAVPAGKNTPTHVAMRQGLAGQWETVPEGEWPQVLGELA